MTPGLIKKRRMEAWTMLAHPKCTKSQRLLAYRFFQQWGV